MPRQFSPPPFCAKKYASAGPPNYTAPQGGPDPAWPFPAIPPAICRVLNAARHHSHLSRKVPMNTKEHSTRRKFLKDTGAIVAVGTLAGMTVPMVHAAQDSTVQVALVGCGGRGTGAAENALRVQSGPVKLVAMADVFQNRLDISHKNLQGRFDKQVEVPVDRRFIGFDAYKQAIDCLKPGDVA